MGNQVAHLLLVSLADIVMDFRMKVSNCAFMLLALLPVSKFMLVGAIVDTPEALLYAGVGEKTSPTTMAMYKQFGDAFQHKPQIASTTLAQLMHIESTIDPWNLDSYIPAAKQFQLHGTCFGEIGP